MPGSWQFASNTGASAAGPRREAVSTGQRRHISAGPPGGTRKALRVLSRRQRGDSRHLRHGHGTQVTDQQRRHERACGQHAAGLQAGGRASTQDEGGTTQRRCCAGRESRAAVAQPVHRASSWHGCGGA